MRMRMANFSAGPVPLALQGLTQVEEMLALISPVMPIMSVYQLPHGHFGYGAHVINLLASLISSLSCHPSSLDLAKY